MDEGNLSAILTVAVSCLIALAISLRFIKQLFVSPKGKELCYLNTESKPQHTFRRVLADNSYSQFKHIKLQQPDSLLSEKTTNLHPFKGEISNMLKTQNIEFLEFLSECYNKNKVVELGGSYIWVENETQLVELVEVLSKQTVFAVDTEQHSWRSFLGFTALIQISTTTGDFLVDTIKLHDVMGLLRPIFSNCEICKVFHGADNDVLWLQRDFHIYIVNMFDTAKACDVLSKPHKSLAYLLKTYCGVTTNKLLRREDWRQRPLPEEMIQYAITDAHYLLYIAHSLCLELKLQKNESSSLGDEFHFLLDACRRSNATCLQLFTKDVEAYPGELAASSMIFRYSKDKGNTSSSQFDSEFQELVRQLCLWRDILARLHDESLRFIFSEKAIIALATQRPTTKKAICTIISKADLNVDSSTFASFRTSSPVVSSHLEDLILLLQDKITNPDNIFELLIKQHLGAPNGCPISPYNYAFLSKSGMRLTSRPSAIRHGFRDSKKIVKRASSRELFVKKFSCKSQVYHNCKIYANDGRLLCYCDRRKLEWYINRNLAKLVEEDPLSIMLFFEPKGRPEDEGNDFYIQSKKNICVCCGEGNHYLRYRIIPSCYRIHFPEHLKSHRSHDIVLLCVDCHEVAHSSAEKYKKQVAIEFGIPLFIHKVVDFDNTQDRNGASLTGKTFEEIGVSPLQLRTAAMALLRHGPNMPYQRREELMQIVRKYYGGREVVDEDLEKALLVGMSPYERKRFEKRRGYTFKYPTQSNNLNTENEDIVSCIATFSNLSVSNSEIVDSSCTNIAKNDQDQDSTYQDLCTGTSFSDIDSIYQIDIEITSDVEDMSRNGNGSLCIEKSSPLNARDISVKHDSKLSLLGHGPHGKQVVEYLLKEHGEDGVRDFCQRWRQVFVEALHPRFLPAGWDVMHSGRRDFGEFSVYNPSKKALGNVAAGEEHTEQQV